MHTLETQVPYNKTALLSEIHDAAIAMSRPGSPVAETNIYRSERLSSLYNADIWFASELHQPIGAYKLRGAYNFMRKLSAGESVVTASAGNHGQAVAYCASLFGIDADVYMPASTPSQKIERVKKFGGNHVRVILTGETFDDANAEAELFCKEQGALYSHPFDDKAVIAGQGTLGLEIADHTIQFNTILCPVGGGGLLSGMGCAVQSQDPSVSIIGVEPEHAASMEYALQLGSSEELPTIDTFIDGAAVRRVGHKTLAITQSLNINMISVTNHDVCVATTELWKTGIKSELAGSLAVAGLANVAARISDQRVLCILSGGNLSRDRFESEVRIH